MSYRERQQLADIQAAIDAIRSHLQRGDLTDGLIFDAVRIRLLEIGEAAIALPHDLLATQLSIPGQSPGGGRHPHIAASVMTQRYQLLVAVSTCNRRLGHLGRRGFRTHQADG